MPTTEAPSGSSSSTTISPASPLIDSDCSVSRPHIPHESDCRKFYHCVSYNGAASKVLKVCGPGTLFNPITMICDWEAAVRSIRPECGSGEEQVIETTKAPTSARTTPTESFTRTTSIIVTPPSGGPVIVDPPKCPPERLHSLLAPLTDEAFTASSSRGRSSPSDARMFQRRVKRQTAWEPSVPFVISSVKTLTADLPGAGMTKGLFGIGGGKFYMRICGARGCCETGHLDNRENNWERGQVNANIIHRYSSINKAPCSM